MSGARIIDGVALANEERERIKARVQALRSRGREVRLDAVLIEAGADVNARHVEGGSTPLHYAVITNRGDVAALLLEKGANLRATDRAGATVLHLAANRGYEALFVELLGRFGGPDVVEET